MMKIGQEVKARFLTLPTQCGQGKKVLEDIYPIRSGIITYIHPRNRFVCVTTHTGGGDVTETFRLCEVMA